ncbi:MAG: hypothetical protein ACRETC_04645 [Gammaproteobacteria bacterium]
MSIRKFPCATRLFADSGADGPNTGSALSDTPWAVFNIKDDPGVVAGEGPLPGGSVARANFLS